MILAKPEWLEGWPEIFTISKARGSHMRFVQLTDATMEPVIINVDAISRIWVDEDDDVVIDWGDDSVIPMGKYPECKPIDVIRSIQAELANGVIIL